MSDQPTAHLLPSRPVYQRYGRSKMWLERLIRSDPSFPKPLYIGRNRYWYLDQLIEWERVAAANSSARLLARGIAARLRKASDAST